MFARLGSISTREGDSRFYYLSKVSKGLGLRVQGLGFRVSKFARPG